MITINLLDYVISIRISRVSPQSVIWANIPILNCVSLCCCAWLGGFFLAVSLGVGCLNWRRDTFMGTFCNATWQADENFCGSNCGTSLTSLSVCGRLHSPLCRRKTRRDVKGKSRRTRGSTHNHTLHPAPCTHCIPWQIIMPNLPSPTWPLGSWSHSRNVRFQRYSIHTYVHMFLPHLI